ncbi:MAG: HypC/HybG/HupF family hydrogenase formation chaperone [Barnesiella sp.]|nr:HypC/HybG/HupF family hydrogenase formation chaperone [Barnesiella sp.]MBD5330345.1 HypC/HybG/HupF family hydrogenase formation chaperone [Bacteroides sp.]MBD5331814.1 HypC/HybG/HupF family hydrogenase formation chaperone [Bacteroides sp.]MDE7460015.1 HypC/HybG/HupF family hydrogenase formation chaperone [Paramuribaculum sp.]
MCLALPGKVIEVTDDGLLRMALVDFCGVCRNVCVDTVDSVSPGDYVVAHAGVAISVLDEATALATIDDLKKMAGC